MWRYQIVFEINSLSSINNQIKTFVEPHTTPNLQQAPDNLILSWGSNYQIKTLQTQGFRENKCRQKSNMFETIENSGEPHWP